MKKKSLYTMPKGFRFGFTSCGIKKDGLEDLGVMVSDVPAVAAGTFTKNLVTAAPVILSKKNLKSKKHFGVICNSGCANAATGERGMGDAVETLNLLASGIGCKPSELLVASTGVTVEFLPMDKIFKGIPGVIGNMIGDPAGFTRAILTTDTGPKSAGKSVTVGGKRVNIWGCTKGAGMYHPNMATMLGFLATDAAVSKSALNSALKEAVDITYNRSTIDGDTSTNDSVFILANGLAGNRPLAKGSADYKKFVSALIEVCGSLAEQIVSGGEGVKRIANVVVEKASSDAAALKVAKSIAGSLLVKTALHGGDPNWGRILVAAGNAGVKFSLEKLDLYFGKTCAMKKGAPIPNAEKKLAVEMKNKKVEIKLVLNSGKGSSSYLFSDLSKEYVTINADYRT